MLYNLYPVAQPELAESELTQLTTRQYKDRLFRHLFSDKERAIELYNAVAGKDYPSDTELEFLPANALIARWNDLAFTIGNSVVAFIEQQSTPNRNMAIRLLQYYSSMLNRLPDIQRQLYGNRLVSIPAPIFYMLYNGTDKIPASPIRL